MNTHCLKCKAKTGYKVKAKLGKTKNGRYMVIGRCEKCDTRKYTFCE